MLKQLSSRVEEDILADGKSLPHYSIGTMIELPRSALLSDKIAESAEFFSFGTNDLTQTTMGISRDDSGTFLEKYIKLGIFNRHPFISLDQIGVGELIKISVEKARQTKPEIKLGICGEHGGDPRSIAFFDKLLFDYVSCSPYRIPVAILSAAQSALKSKV